MDLNKTWNVKVTISTLDIEKLPVGRYLEKKKKTLEGYPLLVATHGDR